MSNRRKSAKTDSAVLTNETVCAELPNEESGKTDSRRRKLHKNYIKGWSDDISRSGFARCIIASCNFVSSDVVKMQEHYKGCKGVLLSGQNLCGNCSCLLATSEELIHHKAACNGTNKQVPTSQSINSSIINNRNDEKCETLSNNGSQSCGFVETRLSDREHNKSCTEVPSFSLFCCIHCRCGFSSKEEHLTHQENCTAFCTPGTNSKKADNLHFRVIKRMKNKDSCNDHIIQPGPDLPKGQYRRRRPYRAEHKNSWALTLEKYKYVKCIYQNCYFIAMSLEDMIAHFGYCNGDGSFAKFVCPYCNGRVTSEAILLKHIERSHTVENASVKVEPAMDTNGDESFTVHPIGDEDFELLLCCKCQNRFPTEEDLSRHLPLCGLEGVNDLSVVESENNNSKGTEEDDLEIGPVVRQYKGRRPKNQPKQRKVNSTNDSSQPISTESTTDISINETPKTPAAPVKKQRGRPRKIKEEAGKLPEKGEEDVQGEEKKTCAKCQYRCTKGAFADHNLKRHYGLSWLEGEEPVDLYDDKLVIRLVKNAFKYTKKAACEKCDVVKRSVMGFVSHVQICGKSEEEKDALRAQCPHCGGKYLKYSLAAHIKLSHSVPEEEEEKSESSVVEERTEVASGKRRSAIKAVTKFQQVLNENDEAEVNPEVHYTFYERGSERMPKLNSKLNNLWYKLKRENKQIPCRHPNCTHLSNDVREAKNHHYSCPQLPEKVFLCELCDFYSVDESTVKSHLTTHRKYLKVRKTSGEEEVKLDEGMYENEEEEDNEEEDDVDEEEEDEGRSTEEEQDDLDESRKRKRKKTNESKVRKKPKFSIDLSRSDLDAEIRLKQNFCRREKIDNIRGLQFFSNGLDMTLQEETKASEEETKASESSGTWPELHTTLDDWCHVPVKEVTECLPKLPESVAVRLPGGETKWRRFQLFESDLIGGVPIMFTGASVRAMSWCKVSYKRMLEKTQKQYLAVTTSCAPDHLKDIHSKSESESSLLQIWDCGPIENDLAETAPKFALGIVQTGGEIWDLAWFPQDTYAEDTENRLRRLGLLATACGDGAVRIWSVCDPEQLDDTKGLPVYRTEPVAMLVTDKDVEESCFKLSVGLNGVIAGGFGNGSVAVWNVKNVSSPFCKKLGKCRIVRAHLVLQAHKTAITGLTFCPSNSRYISTAGLDRFVKVWDLEFPAVPIEQSNKEYSLDNIWTLNWPSVIYNFDDVVINLNKGAVKFIKDILTDRHQSTLAMEDTCLSLSFSDWLNALCGGSITGEVKLRLLKNLIHDQKRSQSTLSSVRLEKLEGCNESENEEEVGRNFPGSYYEVVSRYGLVFKDGIGMDKKKPEKPKAHPEEFPIRAVNKIAFNPNYKSFTHIALGYNCGLIRIQPLKELQTTRSLKFFLEKTEKDNF